MTSRFLQLAKNVSTNYAEAVVGGLIFVVLTPFVVQRLGMELYGTWVLMQTISFYLNHLDFGLEDAQLKYVAEYHGRGEPEGISSLLSTALRIQLLIGVIAGIVALALALLPLAEIFNLPEESARDVPVILTLIGANLLIGFPASAVSGVFVGFQRFEVANALEIGFALLNAVLTFAVLSAGLGLVGLATLQLGITILSLAVDLALIRRMFPAIRLTLHFDTQMWQRLRDFGSWSFLDDLVTEGSAHLDKLILPFLFSVSLLTPYSLVMALAALVLFVSEPITDVLFPLTSNLNANAEQNRLQELLLESTRAVIGVAAPVGVVGAVFGASILDVWVGAEFTQLPSPVLPLMVATLFCSALFWPSSSMLLGMGHVRTVFRYSLVEVLTTLALITVGSLYFGIIGFAIGVFVGNACVGLTLTLPRAGAAVSMEVPRLLRQILSSMGACLPSLACALAIDALIEPTALPEIIIAIFAVGATHALAYLYLAYSGAERMRYYGIVRHVLDGSK